MATKSPAVTGSKKILCVSWLENLAYTRKHLLTSSGYSVDSVLGTPEALEHCANSNADLLIMGQSVPQPEKRKIVEVFRRHNQAPIISLLNPNQEKLPEVEYGVDSMKPAELVRIVRLIFAPKP